DKDGNTTKQFEPRSQGELQSYENLIKSAVGFNPERGDQVTVISVPFEAVKDEEVKVSPVENIAKLVALAVLLLILLGLVIFILLRMKKSKQQTVVATTPSLEALAAGQLAKAYEEEKGIIESFEDIPEYLKILKIAEESPELLAGLISKWLKEEGKKK
ncbi:MAG: flagellar M-ring protein FliF C-terminal domain-containing protein, partial [Hydrogenothermaceae bacterium]